MKFDLKELQKEWFEAEKNKLEQIKKRRYLHFDPRIYVLDEKYTEKIISPGHVVRHSFYPFIRDDKKPRRHKKEDGKNIIKKKIRPISYAAHSDALIYSFYTSILNQYYENKIDFENIRENVLAYKKSDGKSTVDFAGEVFKFISGFQPCVAICFDIKSFFDTMDHSILKAKWQEVLAVDRLSEDHFSIYKSITRFSYVKKDDLLEALILKKRQLGKMQRYCSVEDFHNKIRRGGLIKRNLIKGIPQGAPISAVLSNIYMLDFDIAVSKYISKNGGLYRRYCDDIIVIVKKEEMESAHSLISKKIADLKLEISEDKTETIEFNKDAIIPDGSGKVKKLQYLGLEFDGKKIYLRHRGLAAFQRATAGGVHGLAIAAWKGKTGIVPKMRIYSKYSIYSKKNYLVYANQAAEKLKSPTIAKQVRPGKVMRNLKKRIKKEFRQ